MHPFQAHRQTKVEHSRVGHITKGYALGGAVSSAVVGGSRTKKAMSQRDGQAVGGDPVRQRLDRPLQGRARGGRTGKSKGTHVNVIVAPHGAAPAPMQGAGPIGVPAVGPRPPAPMPMPAGPPGAGAVPPAGPPPGIRSQGGRAYAKGGAVAGDKSIPRNYTTHKSGIPDPVGGSSAMKSRVIKRAMGGAVKPGPAWNQGLKSGTQVQHTSNKQDTPNIGRGKVITYKTGGAVEAPKAKPSIAGTSSRYEHPATGGMSPNLHAGGGGGKARLAKAKIKHDGYRL